ncbi:hypothetical protein L3Q82_011224 [Scortum barcoo]|uniref:Uncharacterized protein n=1 Tax=Scortum barcoo TaxID=214431 RepID=A0ACB8W8X0_9TELE|nr:hypothetical protein L3Q82_011224 [Scortum barcoo]
MTAGVGCGCNKLSTFAADWRGRVAEKESERRKHREQKSHRGRRQEGSSGHRALDGKYNTTEALSPLCPNLASSSIGRAKECYRQEGIPFLLSSAAHRTFNHLCCPAPNRHTNLFPHKQPAYSQQL